MTEGQPRELLPAIRRAKIDRLDIYEVSESELQRLEQSPELLFLTFSVFLLSVSFSFLVTQLTTDIPSIKLFSVFVVLTVLGFISGSVLFGLWVWHRRSSAPIFKEIRSRMRPEGNLMIDQPVAPKDASEPSR